MLIDPVDRIVSILDELQMGAASLSRLLGVAQVPDDREVTGAQPQNEKLEADDVRFSYVDGRDVLHGVDLDVGVGERIAMVGPSGAGKSTLGRLLAGIHPPRTGSVTVGGVGLVELPLDDLRGHVALSRRSTTSSSARSARTSRSPRPGRGDDDDPRRARRGRRARLGRRAARRARHRRRLRRPRAHRRPGAADRARPAGARRPAHAGARRGDLADRPARRRHLERSLAAVLDGRTVIAIAHRLFSAHDADRVAVVEDGVISEFGSHDELVAAGGSYAPSGILERQALTCHVVLVAVGRAGEQTRLGAYSA
jgi:energy-coupling factor transporter ATP-binding protein EcfA2